MGQSPPHAGSGAKGDDTRIDRMTTLRIPQQHSKLHISTGRRWLLAAPLLLAATAVLMWALWELSTATITVDVDGSSEVIKTHRRDVAGVLLDLGLSLDETDRVRPSVRASVQETAAISVSRATPYRISVDERLIDTRSWGPTVGEVLSDAGLVMNPYDIVLIGDHRVRLEDRTTAPQAHISRQTYRRAVWDGRQIEPRRIRVVRAVPITVDDGTLPFDIHTTAQTVGEALRQAEIIIYLGDEVQPSLGSEVLTSMRVSIQRSRPVALEVDGRAIRTRTRGVTVADALAEAQIGLSALDNVAPSLDTELHGGENISIVRVREEIEVEEEIAPFATVYVPDANLPIDTQQLISPGAEGITRSRTRVRHEDGEEVESALEDTWIAQEPAERSIAYGQRIEPKVFTGPDGTEYTYWRKIRMLASSYSAGTAGVSPDKPYYGRTYTGENMRHGIVAVDPAIIPLRSQVFVTGYGEGDALDIGSAIRARRIDLGYDDSNLVLWNKWVDVYLLWPPPADYQITWVLPNWPRPPK